MADEGLSEEFNAKVGGIPVWAIGAGVVVLFVVLYEWRKRAGGGGGGTMPKPASNTVDPSVTDPNAIDPTTGLTYAQEADPTQQPFPTGPIDQYLANNPTSSAYPVGLPAQGTPGPVTNEQWARLSADYLIAHGSVPTDVETALAHYVNGQTLSVVERSIVNLALTAFGSPPEGVIPSGGTTTTTPPPTTRGTPLPADQPTYTYTVKAGDTMRAIVQKWTKDRNNGVAPGPQQISDNLRTVYYFNDFLNGREVQAGDVITLPQNQGGYY
jgi:LysM repeat protein